MASSSDARKAFEELAEALERRIATEQDKVLKVYASAYSDIIAELRRIYRKYAGKDGSVISNMDKTTVRRLTSIGRQCAERLGLAHSEVQQMLEADCREVYGDSFFQIAYRVDSLGASRSVNWGLVPERAADLAILDDYSLLARSSTFQSALNRHSSVVQELFGKAIIEGHSYTRVRDALISRLGVSTVSGGAVRYAGKGVSAWGMMVARTEIHRAYSMAEKKVEAIVEEQGLDIDFAWLATLDGRTRPAHGALDGVRKDREHDGWNVPGIGWVKWPGLSGVASFDINCRCTTMALLRDEEHPEERYERGQDKPVEWKSYEDWKARLMSGGFNGVTAKGGTRVSSMTQHFFDRVSGRGIDKAAWKTWNALVHPLHVTPVKHDNQGRPSKQYIGNDVTVAVNPENGNIVSIWQTGTAARRRYRT